MRTAYSCNCSISASEPCYGRSCPLEPERSSQTKLPNCGATTHLQMRCGFRYMFRQTPSTVAHGIVCGACCSPFSRLLRTGRVWSSRGEESQKQMVLPLYTAVCVACVVTSATIEIAPSGNLLVAGRAPQLRLYPISSIFVHDFRRILTRNGILPSRAFMFF